jgi:hypothetical protein
MKDYFLWVRRHNIFVTIHLLDGSVYDIKKLDYVDDKFIKFFASGFIRVVPISSVVFITEG